ERPLARRKGDVADRREHDDSHDHRQRLPPHRGVTGEHAQIEAAGERPPAEGDGRLQPARPGESGKGPEQWPPPPLPGLVDHLPLLLDPRRLGRGLVGYGSVGHRSAFAGESERSAVLQATARPKGTQAMVSDTPEGCTRHKSCWREIRFPEEGAVRWLLVIRPTC